MSNSEQEIEVKFPVRDLSALSSRLEALGARLVQERVHETNLRFDTPAGELTDRHQVLRLRQDFNAFLTFKGPAKPGEEVSSRQEIEFQVSDFEAARHFLEALGYRVSVSYEKYRAVYSLGDVLCTLDELPFGKFVEIEGPDAGAIRTASAALKLDWEARSTASYLGLFNMLRDARGLSAKNLMFDELQGVEVSAQDLGLRFAD